MVNDKDVILIVEDEPDDLFFLKQAFAEAGIVNPVQEAPNCATAVDYLTGRGDFADRKKFPLPIIVLLDLRLPDKNGVEVLRQIHDLKLRKTVVIVFTSSSNTSDIKAAYNAGATSYVVKPLSTKERNHFAVLMKEYWLKYNLFPPD